MGEKIFRLILEWLEENTQKMPFIDILNRLEKYELIENAEIWLYLRNLRNEIAHQYDDEPKKMTDSLNLIFKEKKTIEAIYQKIRNYYTTRKSL